MKNYFEELPEGLEEAAKMDGASYFRTLFYKSKDPLIVSIFSRKYNLISNRIEGRKAFY
jgi:ABC-type glycerol-3-phosphate transport system permease component